MTSNKKRKLVIIGIDGGTFKIIDPLVKQGKLPNLEKLIKSGVKGILKSTYPPITAAAWVSFMTGKNPGRHGFFDFREYKPTEYTISNIPLERDAVGEGVSDLHSSRFHGQTIWDFLSEAGYEVNVVTVPMTYPPWKVNGRMVAGYPSPDYSKPRTYPPEWSDEVGKIFNMSAINYSRIDEFITECKELVKRKGKIILDQIRDGRGEVFAVVFSSSDFAQHYFWKYLSEKGHPHTSVIYDIYREIDKVVGEILEFMDEDTSIVVMSDHGFMDHPSKYFNVNSWLAQEGYIGTKDNSKMSQINIFSNVLNLLLKHVKHKKANIRLVLREIISKMPLFIRRWASQKYYQGDLIDWAGTRAFRFKMYGTIDGIVINQKGRQAEGTVESGEEYEQLRTEIIHKLLQLRDHDSGELIVAEAHQREDLYKGDFLEKAPDIIIRLHSNYMGGVELDSAIVVPVHEEVKATLSGIHDQNGIFIFCGPNVKKDMKVDGISIVDVIPTILYDLNISIPDDLDGRIIEEALLESYKVNPPKYRSGKTETQAKEILSIEDEESMKESLRSLGYLE